MNTTFCFYFIQALFRKISSNYEEHELTGMEHNEFITEEMAVKSSIRTCRVIPGVQIISHSSQVTVSIILLLLNLLFLFAEIFFFIKKCNYSHLAKSE